MPLLRALQEALNTRPKVVNTQEKRVVAVETKVCFQFQVVDVFFVWAHQIEHIGDFSLLSNRKQNIRFDTNHQDLFVCNLAHSFLKVLP